MISHSWLPNIRWDVPITSPPFLILCSHRDEGVGEIKAQFPYLKSTLYELTLQ